jgi:succinoglycan biosynthesis protein ExoM
MLINICICTFNRTLLLQACLDSLVQMHQPDSVVIKITVVDNDAGQSALPVVESFREAVGLDVIYAVEEKRGIPCARNRALKVSRGMRADLLVFIDDDETVRDNWLIELFQASQSHGHKAAIHGLVIPRLSEGTPANVAGLFKPKVRMEGQLLSSCATDNVMLPMDFVVRHNMMFDESRPLAGGTDTIFFTRAHHLGLDIYQTNTAIVDETVPESRATLKWFLRRKFRSGLTVAWRKLHKGRSRSIVIMSALCQVVIYTIRALAYLVLMSGLKRNENLLRVAKSLGILMGAFGITVDSYNDIDT